MTNAQRLSRSIIRYGASTEAAKIRSADNLLRFFMFSVFLFRCGNKCYECFEGNHVYLSFVKVKNCPVSAFLCEIFNPLISAVEVQVILISTSAQLPVTVATFIRYTAGSKVPETINIMSCMM